MTNTFAEEAQRYMAAEKEHKMKKYELVKERKINRFGTTLYRIRAVKNFTTVSGREVYAGDLGGYIESKKTFRRTAELGLAAIVS